MDCTETARVCSVEISAATLNCNANCLKGFSRVYFVVHTPKTLGRRISYRSPPIRLPDHIVPSAGAEKFSRLHSNKPLECKTDSKFHFAVQFLYKNDFGKCDPLLAPAALDKHSSNVARLVLVGEAADEHVRREDDLSSTPNLSPTAQEKGLDDKDISAASQKHPHPHHHHHRHKSKAKPLAEYYINLSTNATIQHVVMCAPRAQGKSRLPSRAKQLSNMALLDSTQTPTLPPQRSGGKDDGDQERSSAILREVRKRLHASSKQDGSILGAMSFEDSLPIEGESGLMPSFSPAVDIVADVYCTITNCMDQSEKVDSFFEPAEEVKYSGVSAGLSEVFADAYGLARGSANVARLLRATTKISGKAHDESDVSKNESSRKKSNSQLTIHRPSTDLPPQLESATDCDEKFGSSQHSYPNASCIRTLPSLRRFHTLKDNMYYRMQENKNRTRSKLSRSRTLTNTPATATTNALSTAFTPVTHASSSSPMIASGESNFHEREFSYTAGDLKMKSPMLPTTIADKNAKERACLVHFSASPPDVTWTEPDPSDSDLTTDSSSGSANGGHSGAPHQKLYITPSPSSVASKEQHVSYNITTTKTDYSGASQQILLPSSTQEAVVWNVPPGCRLDIPESELAQRRFSASCDHVIVTSFKHVAMVVRNVLDSIAQMQEGEGLSRRGAAPSKQFNLWVMGSYLFHTRFACFLAQQGNGRAKELNRLSVFFLRGPEFERPDGLLPETHDMSLYFQDVFSARKQIRATYTRKSYRTTDALEELMHLMARVRQKSVMLPKTPIERRTLSVPAAALHGVTEGREMLTGNEKDVLYFASSCIIMCSGGMVTTYADSEDHPVALSPECMRALRTLCTSQNPSSSLGSNSTVGSASGLRQGRGLVAYEHGGPHSQDQVGNSSHPPASQSKGSGPSNPLITLANTVESIFASPRKQRKKKMKDTTLAGYPTMAALYRIPCDGHIPFPTESQSKKTMNTCETVASVSESSSDNDTRGSARDYDGTRGVESQSDPCTDKDHTHNHHNPQDLLTTTSLKVWTTRKPCGIIPVSAKKAAKAKGLSGLLSSSTSSAVSQSLHGRDVSSLNCSPRNPANGLLTVIFDSTQLPTFDSHGKPDMEDGARWYRCKSVRIVNGGAYLTVNNC